MRLDNRWYNLDEIIGSLTIYETKQLKSKDLYFGKPKYISENRRYYVFR
jgi:hypothetical protein